jgi:mono/diheme cytochrome c family protein
MNRRSIAIGAAAIAGFVLLLLIGGLVFVSVGAYDVAATKEHTPLARWVMNTTQERSVAARADEVPAPPSVDSAMLRHGLEEYREMCVTCHGAPGVERSELGKGINPEPPDLAKEASEWSDRELFWITKYGIKMAGMPAFGITHSDEELWGIVAFVRRLESMSADEYKRMAGAEETRAHAGMVETERQAETRTQGMDHHRKDQPRTAAHAPRRRTAQQPAAEPQQREADATAKLQTLAAELLRDSLVVARIRADSALRRRWENDTLRRQMRGPPR